MEQEPKTPRERPEDLIRLLVPDWRPTPQQVLWSIRIAIVVTIILLAVLFILYLVGLLFGITVLNLLKVLAVPITLGAAVPLLNWLQKKRELDVEYQRSQDEALQAYMDGMSQLLTDKDQPLHSAQPGDSLGTVARARTLTVLSRLDGKRKGSVLRFLFESDLINKSAATVNKSRLINRSITVINLEDADLSRIALGAEDGSLVIPTPAAAPANLRGANLRAVNLRGADLRSADLYETDLALSDLSKADLIGANLGGADLTFAKLLEANLNDTHLLWAAMERANLEGVRGITNEELDEQGAFLTGATMPNGQKYEEWLKSKDRESDVPNDGSS
jgi:hypothetical protein